MPHPLTALSAGGATSCAVDSQSSAWCWGASPGDGTSSSAVAPLRVDASTGLTTTAAIVSGHGHTCATDAGGVPWCWGANHRGQLGTGGTEDADSPARVRMNAATLGPNAILDSANLVGAVTSIDEDPAADDGEWMTASNAASDTMLHVALADPAAFDGPTRSVFACGPTPPAATPPQLGSSHGRLDRWLPPARTRRSSPAREPS